MTWWRRRREAVTVARMAWGPGDTLILEFPGPLTEDEALRLKAQASVALGDGRVLVLTDGLRASAVLAATPEPRG